MIETKTVAQELESYLDSVESAFGTTQWVTTEYPMGHGEWVEVHTPATLRQKIADIVNDPTTHDIAISEDGTPNGHHVTLKYVSRNDAAPPLMRCKAVWNTIRISAARR